MSILFFYKYEKIFSVNLFTLYLKSGIMIVSMKLLDNNDMDVDKVRKAKRRKQQRERRERQSQEDNIDLQEDFGLHYDSYHGWIKDDR